MKHVQNTVDGILSQIGRVVYGHDDPKRKVVYGVLGDMHSMLVSYPGLAKTLLVHCLQAVISGSASKAIQMTPDMLPKDIIGVRLFNQATGKFDIEFGPVHNVNFLLADELNRATARTQSALLSAMQERKVMINGVVYKMLDPFNILATRNPIEQEGTYDLPEAQADRFGEEIYLGYTSADDELKMLMNMELEGREPWNIISPQIDLEGLKAMRAEIKNGVYVSKAAFEYIIGLVRATRPQCPENFDPAVAKFPELKQMIKLGCSPRAEQTLVKLSRVVAAASEGRDYVLPEDIRSVVYEVMRHRMMLHDAAKYDGATADDVVERIVKAVPIVEKLENFKRG
jgi:MoxR-like ATPase